MAAAERTRDHDTIRRWAEARGGVPALVEGTGVLRIDFVEGPRSGGHEERLEEVDWDEWFRVFDRSDVDFLYQDEEGSRFNKIVSAGGE